MDTSPMFLKWAGGKRRILPALAEFFPSQFNAYYEPFLGGGSVFFYVKQNYDPAWCYISDTNIDLVNTYKAVRDNPSHLIEILESFKNQHSKDFYYQVRSSYNEHAYPVLERAAAFIYLNKTCFNGLYRVNKKNEFNVPFGQHKAPGIYSADSIYAASKLLNDRVTISHQDFKEIVPEVRNKDFVYLDPCYDPLKKTSFANYTPERFTPKDRLILFKFIEALRKKGAQVVLSNNDLDEIRDLYSSYLVNEITAPRMIGSKLAYRSTLTELVITTP